jgi:glyoxylase-like metal-dependent hydrolase (beta-lactamase superfamily II)
MLHVTEDFYVIGRSGWGKLKPLCRGYSCNVFLVNGGDEMALIDVGEPEGVVDMIANIKALGFDPKRIGKLILTHSHGDHAAAVSQWLKHVDAQVYGHALARETLGAGPGIFDGYVPPQPYPGPVHRVVKEGDVITVGRYRFGVVELPGHTPDSIGLTVEMAGGLGCFSGDTAIGDQAKGKGIIGWIDGHWCSQLNHFKLSLDKMAKLPITAMFPGHGVSHLGESAVRTSLDNCSWRLGLLLAIPELDTMMPLDLGNGLAV